MIRVPPPLTCQLATEAVAADGVILAQAQAREKTASCNGLSVECLKTVDEDKEQLIACAPGACALQSARCLNQAQGHCFNVFGQGIDERV